MSPRPKLKRERPSEAKVKVDIRAALDAHGWFWWNVPMNAYAKAGISDIHAVKAGVFMVIEGKRDDKEDPTLPQKAFLSTIKSHDHFAFVVDRDNLPVFRGFLVAFDRACLAQTKGRQPAPEDGAAMLDAIREMQRKF